MIDTASQLKIPKPDPNFFILKEDKDNLARFHGMSENHPVNILVTGNQGCG